MEELFRFLETYELWIYVLLGAIALISLRKLVGAWQDWQGSAFGLERDIAFSRFSTALTTLVLVCLLVLGEFLLVSFVIPAAPRTGLLPTPTLNVLTTPTVTLAAASQNKGTPGAAPANAGVPANAGTAPAGTAPANAGVPANAGTAPARSGTPGTTTPGAAALSEGCKPGSIEWSVPKAGQEIKGTVELKGTVNIPSLGFYKYEFGQPGKTNWTAIAAGNTPKINGQIGFWNTSRLVPGDYLLRLVVIDNQNQTLPACVVQVRVVAP